jgi:gluconate 2-dehydrogenase gamma chain
MTETQRETLAAAVGRILPSEDGPGAREAGVQVYQDRALDHPFFQGMQSWFAMNLDGLAERARTAYGCELAACDPQQQDALLRQMQEDPNPAVQHFFVTLVSLTVEGFLGDPIHGGNRDEVGWKAVGYAHSEPRTGFCVHGGTRDGARDGGAVGESTQVEKQERVERQEE